MKDAHRDLGEELLSPGQPTFEFWGHEACWIPMDLYPYFGFRRKAFRKREWVREHRNCDPKTRNRMLKQIRDNGAVRSLELEGKGSSGWWRHKTAKKIAVAMWFGGELAIRERKNFQRAFDLPERVIPEEHRRDASLRESLPVLLGLALQGHGWATLGTLADTWRMINMRPALKEAIHTLEEDGTAIPCRLVRDGGRPIHGWIHRNYVERLDKIRRLRPQEREPVLLSPFDPVLWDRKRVQLLFGFEQALEIFKPAPQRKYGYFCLPTLAGESLVGRTDLKANRKEGRLSVLSEHVESTDRKGAAAELSLIRMAQMRLAQQIDLEIDRKHTRSVGAHPG